MPENSILQQDLAGRLSGLSLENRLREIPSDGTSCRLIDLCSNDYLGLACRAGEWREEFLSRFPDAQFSSSASRLLSRRQRYHDMLERHLAGLYGKEALVFNSGYHANVGCIGALNLPSTLFVADKLIHASVIDGLHTCRAEYVRFRHNDVGHLEKVIEQKGKDFSHIVVVAESVYSMDGDIAPLADFVALRRRDPRIVLYVDEAHGVGVFGERGLGVCEETGLIGETDLIIGTAGKALASAGAYAICSDTLRRWLLNASRPFIFSTALPPATCAWTLLMLEKMERMEKEREHLRRLWKYAGAKLDIAASSQIIPFLTGDASRALRLASSLHSEGFDVLPIRRPTVPPGGERLRISLNALLTEADILPMLDMLAGSNPASSPAHDTTF